MRTYILKRLLLIFPNLIGITLITFCVMRLAPGDPAAFMKGGAATGQAAGKAPPKEAIQKWRKAHHLDESLPRQYWYWLKGMATLNLGEQYRAPWDPITKIVWEGMKVTVWLNVGAIFLIYLIAIPIGIYSAARQYTLLDRVLTVTLFALYSLPSFWVATLALNLVCGDRHVGWPWLFSAVVVTLPLGVYLAWGSRSIAQWLACILGVGLVAPAVASLAMAWVLYNGQRIDKLKEGKDLAFMETEIHFPTDASETHEEFLYDKREVTVQKEVEIEEDGVRKTVTKTVTETVLDRKVPLLDYLGHRLWHIFLPLMCLTYGGFAFISRQMRAGMLENIRQDYIRTARAKGLSERTVVLKHALRNSLIPVVTLLGTLLPALLGGSVILERIFALKGMGWIDFDAIIAREYDIVMGVTVLASVLTLVGILISDMLYVLVNPRINLE